MLRFEWNALRPGDHVAVHDDADSSFALHDGVVTLVQTAPRANDVAVHLDHAGSGPAVVRPRRMAVHLLPIDRSEPCWRCAGTSARDDGRDAGWAATRHEDEP